MFSQKPHLTDLEAFAVLAEELHFQRAATRLGTSQPHVSQRIRRLEEVLETRLFTRRPRTSLTAAGQAFLDSTKRILTELEFGMSRASAQNGDQRKTVVVGFASTAMFSDIPTILSQAARRIGSTLVLRELHSGVQMEALLRGAIQLALVRDYAGAADVEQALLLEDPLVAVIRGESSDLRTPAFDPSRLRDEPFVLFPRETAPVLHDQIMTACASYGFTPNVVQEVEEWHTVVALVAAGIGVSLAPSGVARLGWPGVVYRRFGRETIHATLHLCWRRTGIDESAAELRDALLAGISPTVIRDSST